MTDFYVYEHWRPDKSEPFYVGKGRGRRAWKLKARNPHHGNVLALLKGSGLKVDVRIIHAGLSAEDAYAAEIARIAFLRGSGVRLTNQTGGGEGSLNPSEELRSRLSAMLRSYAWTTDRRAKVAKAAAELPKSSLERRSRSLTGIVRSDQTRSKISASKMNPPECTRRKNSVAAKTGWANPDIRAKQVAARLGAVRITDGTCNRTIRPGEDIPHGWRRGLTKRCPQAAG